MDRSRLVSAREVEGLIADGHLIVVYDGYALKLDNWLDKHPGGHLAIKHMVGRDATDEINVYHQSKTLRAVKAWRIGRVQLPWTNLEPPIRGGVHRKVIDFPPVGDVQVVAEADFLSDNETNAETLSLWSSRAGDPLSSSNSSIGAEECSSGPSSGTSKDPAAKDEIEDGISIGRPKPPPPDVPWTATNPTIATILSHETYTAAMEQKEIADGIRNYPSLDSATQQAIRTEYEALHRLVQEKGYYNCPYFEYSKEVARYLALFSVFLYLLHAGCFLTSAAVLGLFWQQVMFTAHDAGHRGITGNFIIDTVIGAFIGDFCCGLSIGWWKSSHNVHHLVTNMPEHDPDIQNVPLFSTSPTYFKSIRSTFYNIDFVWDKAANILVPYQKYTYYPVMMIARFNLHILSWLHLFSPRAAQLGSAWWTRWLEVVFMTGYWYVFGYLLVAQTLPDWPTRLGFVLVSYAITMILHVQITLSHWGMPTSDLGPSESFPQRQLRTTMDVDCPEWMDFVHGGLQFQAVHHLFPRMPRHNLRKCQKLVREFCAKTGIKYQCHGFVEGNKTVLSRLEEVAKMVETLAQCHLHELNESYNLES